MSIRLALTGFCLFRRHQCDLPPIPYSFPLTSTKRTLHKACYTSCGVCIMQFTEHPPHTVRCAVSVCDASIACYSKKTDITRTAYPSAIPSKHNFVLSAYGIKMKMERNGTCKKTERTKCVDLNLFYQSTE